MSLPKSRLIKVAVEQTASLFAVIESVELLSCFVVIFAAPRILAPIIAAATSIPIQTSKHWTVPKSKPANEQALDNSEDCKLANDLNWRSSEP